MRSWVLYLPLCRFQPERVSFGGYDVCRDKPEVWERLYGRGRPSRLDACVDTRGQPIPGGTIISSDEDPPNRQHLEYVVATLYYLSGGSRWFITNAESFYRIPFFVPSDPNDEDWVVRASKYGLHGDYVGDDDGLRIFPPQFAARVEHAGLFDGPKALVLDKMLTENPGHHLVRGLYFYFVAHFADRNARWELEDVVNYFTALQCVLGVPNLYRKQELRTRLTDRLDCDTPEIEKAVEGWFDYLHHVRGAYTHGALVEDSAIVRDRTLITWQADVLFRGLMDAELARLAGPPQGAAELVRNLHERSLRHDVRSAVIRALCQKDIARQLIKVLKRGGDWFLTCNESELEPIQSLLSDFTSHVEVDFLSRADLGVSPNKSLVTLAYLVKDALVDAREAPPDDESIREFVEYVEKEKAQDVSRTLALMKPLAHTVGYVRYRGKLRVDDLCEAYEKLKLYHDNWQHRHRSDA